MISVNIVSRILVLALFAIWQLYWKITAVTAEKEKPKLQKSPRLLQQIAHGVHYLAGVLIGLQLIGLDLLPIQSYQIAWQFLGLSLVSIGFYMNIKARRDLGTNWVSSYEYQIKTKQDLITRGIYAYIRHPIYSGLVLMYIGGQMVALSYLFLPAILLFVWLYIQGRKEETLLLQHFGKRYKEYMQRTKMFIPFIF